MNSSAFFVVGACWAGELLYRPLGFKRRQAPPSADNPPKSPFEKGDFVLDASIRMVLPIGSVEQLGFFVWVPAWRGASQQTRLNGLPDALGLNDFAGYICFWLLLLTEWPECKQKEPSERRRLFSEKRTNPTGNTIDHDEVLLVPMDDARQICLVAQLLPRELDARRTESDSLGGIADAQQRNALARDMALLAETLQRIMLTRSTGR